MGELNEERQGMMRVTIDLQGDETKVNLFDYLMKHTMV